MSGNGISATVGILTVQLAQKERCLSACLTRSLVGGLPSVVCALCLWLSACEDVDSFLLHDTATVTLAWLMARATTFAWTRAVQETFSMFPGVADRQLCAHRSW